jgi:hypothetical protein
MASPVRLPCFRDIRGVNDEIWGSFTYSDLITEASQINSKINKAYSMVPSMRIAFSIILQASRSTALRPNSRRWLNPYRTAAVPVSRVRSQVRWQSQGSAAGDGGSKAYAFDEVSEDISRNARSSCSFIVPRSILPNPERRLKNSFQNPPKIAF